MAVKLEFKGSDIDEAVKAACKRFGVDRDALEINVLSTGSTGIFGLMRKQSVVQASLKGDQAAENPKVEKPKAPTDKKKRPRTKAKPTPKIENEDVSPDEEVEVREETRQPRRPKVEPSPVPPEFHDQLKGELGKLLSLMGMESEIVIGEENGKTKLEIVGDHVAALQDRDGQALDGLQYLLRKMTSDKLPERAMFVVDAGGFRTNRRSELEELAVRLADEVKELSVTRTIPPLNPSERRIVHMMLQDDNTIRSRSVGSGLFKKILIYKPGTQRPRSPSRKRGSRSRPPRK
ncbi:MAG: Jag N-terminal domain-containing protein [Proteobacteria bacterium]|nr:Jag N-terminal domain-containing protein [Pseudomonadota bacterium]MBU1639819.1 Jag N-terminal domain-containing protein [Pseudomonadota bacterium]